MSYLADKSVTNAKCIVGSAVIDLVISKLQRECLYQRYFFAHSRRSLIALQESAEGTRLEMHQNERNRRPQLGGFSGCLRILR